MLTRQIDGLIEGFEVPRGWAPAYRELDRNVIVLAPLGLHLLLRYARRFVIWLRWAGWRESQEQYIAGFLAGRYARRMTQE